MSGRASRSGAHVGVEGLGEVEQSARPSVSSGLEQDRGLLELRQGFQRGTELALADGDDLNRAARPLTRRQHDDIDVAGPSQRRIRHFRPAHRADRGAQRPHVGEAGGPRPSDRLEMGAQHLCAPGRLRRFPRLLRTVVLHERPPRGDTRRR